MGANVLISGAGVAGSTLAYWLARHGYRVTVTERAAGLRSSGNPVDVKGAAVEVAERMGVMPQLRAAASHPARLVFADDTGRIRSSVGMRSFQSGGGDREVEVSRSVLAATLLAAGADTAEIRWGDSITALTPAGAGVDVTFEQGAPEHFDLVVGADGVHSTVRRLAFGPETEFTRNLGMYVATLPVDRPFGAPDEIVVYNRPGAALSVHPGAGQPVAAFMFRHTPVPDLDYRDVERQRAMITAAYDGRLGVFAPYLDAVRSAPDVYFDAVTRVVLPHWSSGRITLVGDAASSLSLFGDGSTLAICGAYTLAEELAATPADIAGALTRYERRHRKLVRPRQRGFHTAGMLLVPKTRTGIAVRDNAVRVLSR
ncbi:FAD-dependent monooxygenase [Nocardia sp. alder85J]|uniref:FAD-dependent monooxygenase n=1 Tax=Nocardia sp. alder85J TaxID=2862949 RepID=UPI001CD79ECF|nr:FAD-dependent monooxygenase [Nocardia sp. alder85J]MCX4093752.1 FAD-dependent monooxygenase [Nocardia sp. alder85J]